MKTKLAVWVSLLALVIFAGGKATFGQAATSLRGSVMDPSGAAIPNATVQLINTGTNATRTAYTDAQGAYDFLQVVPGTYRLEVQAKGFSKYVQNSIQLLVNLPATVNVKMRLGTQSQTVTVTEAAPVLNTTDASEGNTMGEQQLEQLPIEARDVVQLLSLQPGVVYASDRPDFSSNMNDTRQGAVNGEKSDQNNVTLDGVDDNEQNTGQAFQSVLPVPVESLQEFRVSTTNYGADQGRSAGAQVALVTKGGPIISTARSMSSIAAGSAKRTTSLSKRRRQKATSRILRPTWFATSSAARLEDLSRRIGCFSSSIMKAIA